MANRGGGIESMEITGILHLLVSDSNYEKIAIKVAYDNSRAAQMTVSPYKPTLYM